MKSYKMYKMQLQTVKTKNESLFQSWVYQLQENQIHLKIQ